MDGHAGMTELGSVALVLAGAGMLVVYTFTLGAGSPNRQVTERLGVTTWLVPPCLVIVSSVVMVLATSRSPAVLVAVGALAVGAWSLRYPPDRDTRKRRRTSSRVAPPADRSRRHRGLALLVAVALEVVAFVLGG